VRIRDQKNGYHLCKFCTYVAPTNFMQSVNLIDIKRKLVSLDTEEIIQNLPDPFKQQITNRGLSRYCQVSQGTVSLQWGFSRNGLFTVRFFKKLSFAVKFFLCETVPLKQSVFFKGMGPLKPCFLINCPFKRPSSLA